MRQRSKFWTFVFSLLPGAGHMYLGLNKIGSSYMITFFLAIFISSLPGLSLFGFLCPLIWFLAFFDCLNKMGLTPDELAAVDDQFFLSQFIPLEGEQADRCMKTKLP